MVVMCSLNIISPLFNSCIYYLFIYSEIGRVPLPVRQPVVEFPPYIIFSLEEIEDATNNFDPSNLIAEGSQGQVKVFSYLFINFIMIISTSTGSNGLYSCICTAIQRLAHRWFNGHGQSCKTKAKKFAQKQYSELKGITLFKAQAFGECSRTLFYYSSGPSPNDNRNIHCI